MKLSVISDGAKWVYDAIAKDFRKYTRHEVVSLDRNPDVVWCLNFWALPRVQGMGNIVAHLHHVNKEKIEAYNFEPLDRANCCLVPNAITEDFAKIVTTTKVIRMPYWLLSERMDLSESRRQEIIDTEGQILIGSFQKDSDSRTGSPKMVKGPDVFLDIVEQLDNVKVVLAGYDRQYMVNELKSRKIPFVYYERDNDLNSLYDALDWYLITSREEGGPQAALEAPYRKVKTLSTPVGIVPEVLHEDCLCVSAKDFVSKINEGNDYTEQNYESVCNYVPERLIPKYDDLFEEVADGQI